MDYIRPRQTELNSLGNSYCRLATPNLIENLSENTWLCGLYKEHCDENHGRSVV